ncbi:hypothetical protein [Neobacillus sp. Marseille-QA0830]
MGLFDWFGKRTLSKAEMNRIIENEWLQQKSRVDEIIITECQSVRYQDDLGICLESGLHKEFVQKLILDLFIDNFGYELGAIHGTSYNVTEITNRNNGRILEDFLAKIDRLAPHYPFRDIHTLKQCYQRIGQRVIRIGRERGKENYSLFKDTLVRK